MEGELLYSGVICHGTCLFQLMAYMTMYKHVHIHTEIIYTYSYVSTDIWIFTLLLDILNLKDPYLLAQGTTQGDHKVARPC